MSTVITEANENTPTLGGLFTGLSFFLTQRIPQRSHYMHLVQSNGGRVLRVEAQADYTVADHLRKDAPSGSVSYTFIEAALREGTLPDSADHAAGPVKGTVRPVGSVVPGKSTRSPFTADEDCMLYTWVERAIARGEAAKGNELDQKIEAAHPRHTYQSWRDRYIKKLHGSPPEGHFPGGFKQEDVKVLLGHAEWIENMVEDRVDEAWTAYAEVCTQHNAVEWANFYQQHVRPVYLENSKKIPKEQISKKRKHADESTVDSVHKRDSVKPAKTKLEQSAQHRNDGRFQQNGVPTPASDVDSAQNDADIAAGSTATAQNSKFGRQQQREDDADESVDGSESPVVPDEGQTSDTTKTQASTKAATAVDVIDAEEIFRREINAPSYEAQNPESHTQKTRANEPEYLGSNVPTSDLNRAADRQMRRESIGESDAESEAVDEATPTMVVSQLTEANLYSHHQGNKSPTIRGVDIPEDDESEDQEQFVSYLSSLIKKDSPAQVILPREESDAQHTMTKLQSRQKHTTLGDKENVALRKPIRNDVLPESDLGLIDDDSLGLPVDTGVNLMNYTNSQTMQHHDSDLLEEAMDSDLPMSSQQEAHVGEGSILWPNMLDMASSAVEKENATYFSDAQRRAKDDSRPHVTARVTHDEQEIVGKDAEYDSEEMDVDLTVVEPEGGFELSSTFKLTSPVSRSERTRNVAINTSADILDDHYHRTGSFELDVAEAARSQRSNGERTVGTHKQPESRPSPDERAPGKRRRTKARALETQDILDMETQVLDLDLPPPPDSDDDDSSIGSVVEARPSKSADREPCHFREMPLRESSIEEWQTGLLSSDADDEQDADGDAEDLRHTAVPPPAPTPPQQYAQSPLETQGTRKLGNVVRLLEGDDVDEYITTLNIRHGFSEDVVSKALIRTSMRPELTEIVLFDERSGRGFPNDVPGIWSAEEDLGIESGAASRVREAEVKHGWEEVLARLEFLRDWRDT